MIILNNQQSATGVVEVNIAMHMMRLKSDSLPKFTTIMIFLMAYINVNKLRAQLFHKVEDGELLDVYESMCMYEFASQIRCASSCLQRKSPPCVSFSYEKKAELCSLSTSITRQANRPSALVNVYTLFPRGK